MQMRLHVVAPHGCASQWWINAVQFGGVDLLVATWNVRVIRHSPVWFFPTIRAALIARRFYFGCLCPGCGQRGSVDLRRVNRHPDASLESLIPMLSCQRCSPNPPFARLTGVSRRRR
jgi:hypothetical protein